MLLSRPEVPEPSAAAREKALVLLGRRLGPSRVLSGRESCERFASDDSEAEGRGLLSLLAPIGLTLLPMALIALEPDLSTSVIVFLIFLSVMVVVRLKLRAVLALAGVALASLPILWFTLADYPMFESGHDTLVLRRDERR